jgi:predicted nucleic acid-binding protein
MKALEQIWLLDTNVIVRHLLQDHPEHSARATTLIRSIESNERTVRISDAIVCELVYVLNKRYGIPRQIVKGSVIPILELPGVLQPGKRIYHDIFDLWVEQPSLAFVDCYQLCLARHLGLPGVITFDRKMNRLPGVEQIEP